MTLPLHSGVSFSDLGVEISLWTWLREHQPELLDHEACLHALLRESPDVRGSQAVGPGHEEGKGRKKRKGKGGRGAGPGVLCYHQSGCHNSSTVASCAGWAMGFHRAVNHLPGSHAFPPVLKRLGFLSHRSDGKLGEGGGGQVLEIFSGGIPNRIPLKSDPGWEVDAVQLTSGPRCASARTNSCIEDSWAISSGHPHWECFLLPCRQRGREAPCTQ